MTNIEIASHRAEEIKKEISLVNAHTLKAGILLGIARDKEDWKQLGYESETEYFESHLGLKKSACYNRIGVAREFGEKKEALDTEYSRLVKLLPLVSKWKDKPEKMDEALTAARTYPPKGWHDFLRACKGLTPTDECKHEETYTVEVCKECNRRVPVNST